MSTDLPISREVTDRQVAMFAMFVGPGLFATRAALAAASKVPESTLRSYAAGAAMPLAVALHLARFLPRHAIDMVTEPSGLRLTEVEHLKSNWDRVAADGAGLVAEICEERQHGRITPAGAAKLKKDCRRVAAELLEIAGDGG